MRVPTIAFKVDGRDSAELVRAIDAHKIGIRYGDFHSRRLVERLGLTQGNGVVRVSMVHYNTLGRGRPPDRGAGRGAGLSPPGGGVPLARRRGSCFGGTEKNRSQHVHL